MSRVDIYAVQACCDSAEELGLHNCCCDEYECTDKRNCGFYADALLRVAELQRLEDIA